MGPPPRPNPDKAEKEEKEKITDISDVTDVFHGSGIDLREEENYMTNTFRNVHGSGSFNSSFGSNSTVQSPNSSFNLLTQGSLGSQPAFSGSGPISQPTASQETVEEELDRKHHTAAHKLAEKRQQHLNDAFLQTNNVRHRMHKLAYEQGVALNVEGLFDKIPERAAVHGVTANGPNGTSAASLKAHGLLQENTPLADILALVCLAANERVRTLLDQSYTIARGRRYGSDGLVPPDLADLAIGDNPTSTSVVPTSITGTAWDQPPKRDSDGEVKVKDESPGTIHLFEDRQEIVVDMYTDIKASPMPSKAFSTAISKSLVDAAKRDRDAERERVRKRQERARRANAGDNPDAVMTAAPDIVASPIAGTASVPATPGAVDAAASSEANKPMTKKERERQAKAGQSEEVLHKNANTTAAMQLGMGKKKKKYSWMAGAAAAPVNPYKPSPKTASANHEAVNGNGAGKSPSGNAPAGVDRALQVRERKWGGWRESGIEGRGVQMRDWVVVLDRDGREKKALQKCLLNMDSNTE